MSDQIQYIPFDIDIEQGCITLQLSCNDVAALAKACAIAEAHTIKAENVADKTVFKAWAVAFKAMTVASMSQYSMFEKHKEKATRFADELLAMQVEE